MSPGPAPAGDLPTAGDIYGVVDSWLLAVVSAQDHHDLLSIGVAACAAGLSQVMVRCTRCSHGSQPPMKFTELIRHVRDSEAAYLDNYAADDGPHAALHGPGDLVIAPPPPTRPRSSSKTRRWRQR